MSQKIPGTTGPRTRLDLHDVTTGATVTMSPQRLVIAGYTASDRDAVERHIAELASLGVAPPPSVPAYYPMPVELLHVGEEISVTSTQTSGEVEPVLFCTGNGWYIGVGSDHTARDVERESIPDSKAACPKPISSAVLPYEEVARRRDTLTLRSHADGGLYQEAPLTGLLPIPEIIAGYQRLVPGTTEGLVVFCGTVPLLSGEFRYSTTFRAELVASGQTLLTCDYRTAIATTVAGSPPSPAPPHQTTPA